MLAVLSPIRRARRAPPAGLASGAASPELRLWEEPRHAGSGPNHLHMSLLGRKVLGNLRLSHFLGTHRVSLRVCGFAKPSQGPMEPGAFREALSLGGQATAGGALKLPFPSL